MAPPPANPRTLAALGLDVVPAQQPLAYPGRPAPEPSLLTGPELLALAVRPLPLGAWTLGHDGRVRELDHVLAALGGPVTGRRHPVLAVGSNACPAQLAHKFAACGLDATVPMVPVRVRGIGVGCSGHIGRAGYVAAAPYADPDAERLLVVSWLDAAQLAAVDVTEGCYRRVLLPGERFAMTLPSGERLGGAYVYVSKYGVLTDPRTGAPRPGGRDQSALLAALLASPRLHRLLGPDPASWVRRAAADPVVRAEGTGIFAEEGWTLQECGLPPAQEPVGAALCHDELPGPSPWPL